MNELLKIAFSGDGAVILQIVGIGIGSWVGASLLSAVGKGNFAKILQVAATLVCIGLALATMGRIIASIM